MLTLVNCREKEPAKPQTDARPGGVLLRVCVECVCVRVSERHPPLAPRCRSSRGVRTDDQTTRSRRENESRVQRLYKQQFYHKNTEAMQSQGSTSSQPSFDSLSSSDSLLFSDSEQAEDDTDVFLTDGSSSAITDGASGPTATEDRESESPGSQWMCDGFTDKEEEDESYRPETGGKAARAGLGEVDQPSKIPKSQGDLLFAQKCAELQGFIRPLLELLNGLKKGRFDRGLSSFQQSVAMDRIQRIVGVLQRPNIGEKYLNTLLQVEMMLKLWFPQIPTQPASTASSVTASPTRSLQDTSSVTPPHKHRDQLHIPVKKRRLSWTGTDSPTPSPVLLKCPRVNVEEKSANRYEDGGDGPPPSPPLASDANQTSPVAASKSQNDDAKGTDSDGNEQNKLSKYKAGQSSEPSLTWVHVAPILSPRKACLPHEGTTAVVGNFEEMMAPGRRGSPAMQDSSISSTTSHKQSKNEKVPTPCQSPPDTEQQSERETAETCQGRGHSPHVTLKPLPRACPATLET